MDMEKVIRGLECCSDVGGKHCYEGKCPYASMSEPCREQLAQDAIELLKEQEEQERKWLQTIADNQIANAPNDSPMSLDEQLESEYKSGIYDGLQMAYEILMEGR